MLFEEVTSFIKNLDLSEKAIWKDRHGTLEIVIGENIVQEYFNTNDTDWIVAEYLEIHKTHINVSNKIIAVGGFDEHNKGKLLSCSENKYLITIPVPLTNDSFGTNRCAHAKEEPSFECVFPGKIIIDIGLLTETGIEKSVTGIGEFTGLYFSLLDYWTKNEQIVDKELLKHIVENQRGIYNSFCKNDTRGFVKRLALCLISKCLIMRSHYTHEIGCGIDHSFARVLERDLFMPHGKAVYQGSIIASILFPEWNFHNFGTENLIRMGNDLRIISPAEIERLCYKTDIEELVKKAISIRPNRRTMLDSFKNGEATVKFEHYKKLCNGPY